MDPDLSTKRKRVHPTTANARQNESTGIARKRAKTQDARSIAVQSSEKALKDGQLDVDKFVKAREYEIRALEAGLSKSKQALTTRAFQSVPRDLRRRTASHNVKRVPKRLRGRAAKEMNEDNTPTVTARRRKPTPHMRLRTETAKRWRTLGAKATSRMNISNPHEKDPAKMVSIQSRQPKAKQGSLEAPPRSPSKFRKRQLHKTWLPTHLFHAKRAHMTPPKEPLWRFALPLTPTEKSYRPTHRVSSERGAIAWDTSYMATIGMEGLPGCIEGALKALGIDDGDEIGGLWGKSGRKWRAGKRSLDIWTFENNLCPNKPIAPVTVVWCAAESEETACPKAQTADADMPVKAKIKKRIKALMRVHPSAFLQLWDKVLRVSKLQNPPVLIEDLRFEMGSIEITGSESTEVLLGTLKPKTGSGVHDQSPETPENTWSSLVNLSNPACLPPNALLGFSVSDPRLSHPPRTLTKSQSTRELEQLQCILAAWPPDSTQCAPSLFDRNFRHKACLSLPSQKAINRRKGLAPPGQYPEALSTDPDIPVLLLASRPASLSAQGIWTVLLPWRCVLPVWYSLVHYPLSSGGSVRFGGLREKRQVVFEAGMPWFPADYPGTRAGWDWELMEREKRQKEHLSMPKGKRIAWESVDLGDGRKGEIGLGWGCNWEKLLAKHPPETLSTEQASAPSLAGEVVNTSPPNDIHHLPLSLPPQPRTSPLPNVPPWVKSLRTGSVLMTAKVTMLTRGTPSPCARIYSLSNTQPELRHRWLSLVPAASVKRSSRKTTHTRPAKDAPAYVHRQHLAKSLLPMAETNEPVSGTGRVSQAGDANYPVVPGEDALIGFVTTGNYNLHEGNGTGIGCIDITKVKEWKGKEASLCIIREAGQGLGRLARWETV